MRAAVQSMSESCTRVAAYVTQNLATPGPPPRPLPAAAPADSGRRPPPRQLRRTRPAKPAAKPARPAPSPASQLPNPGPAGHQPAKPAAPDTSRPIGRLRSCARWLGFRGRFCHWRYIWNYRASAARIPVLCLPGEWGRRDGDRPQGAREPGTAAEGREAQRSLLHLACTLK